MRNTIVYLEFPDSPKKSFVRSVSIISTLIIGSYLLNRKLYPFSNAFLTILLTLLYTDQLDYTILYSAIIGMAVFGYHNFRCYSPKLSEPYRFTGQGAVLSVIASVVGFYVSDWMED
jgi:hypothetical protein